MSASRVDAAIAEFLQAAKAGSPLEREAWLAKYPDLRSELEGFLKDQSAFHRVFETIDQNATLPPREVVVANAAMTPRFFADYELLEEIGRGGMGVIWKARQISLNRPVALKMILAGQLASAADVQRFKTEAEAAANLDHSSILPIYEVGERDGQHYFSMKLIEGGSLADVIRSTPFSPREERDGGDGGLTERHAVEILVQVARAIHFAHQRGILHRDLKPANILLDHAGIPYVTDFGLARKVEGDSALTQSGAIVGTPSYMAPEQARAEKALSTSVDVYSLGAILYEMLTSQPPFRGPTVLDTVMKVIMDEPADPRTLNPATNRDLALIALKCLAKDPAGRYESAASLADELERWLRGDPLTVRPLTLPELAWRWARKNTAAAVTVPLIGILWGASMGLAVVAISAPNAYIVPPNISWLNPLWWYARVSDDPNFRWGLPILAGVVTFLVAWLIRWITRPKSQRIAFGFAAISALIAMQVAGLFIGPFITTNTQTDQVHPLATEDELADWFFFPEYFGNRLQKNSDPNYLAKYLPSSSPSKMERDQEIMALRRKAQRTNRISTAWVASSLGTLFGVVFFLGSSMFGMYAAEIMLRSRRSLISRWTLYLRIHGIGLLLTFISATYLMTMVQFTRSNASLPPFLRLAYWTFLGAGTGYLIITHRSIARDWKWWKFELIALAWLLSAAVLLTAIMWWSR
ncbi:MAG TPA: serine/threonine-protein kinase [Gemmataceae bacterium]|nr:serine/threonine-protein kinase [Gemmataceae bacterium]